jgi:hypothetical protein
MGWVTVALYLLAAWTCFLCARRSRAAVAQAPSDCWEPRLWALFALVLLALGINKQLDLQTAFTEVMRGLAKEEGWYEARRHYQHAFIAALAVVAACAGVAVAFMTRWLDRTVQLGAFGIAFLLTFVTVRAMSFHHVDALLGTRVLQARLNWIFEIGGISILILGSALRLRRSKRGEGAVSGRC